MLFSDLYKSTKSPLSRLRQHSLQSEQSRQPALVSREYPPDLWSKDKVKQKEAVRHFLAERVRNDWVFNWPPLPVDDDEENFVLADAIANLDISQPHPAATTDSKKSGESALSVDDDGYHCDDDASSVYSVVFEDPAHFCPRAEWLSDLSDGDDESVSPMAYRFESPDAVASTVKAAELARSAKRRRAARAEMEWNSGLACFTARRDAWTGARVVRVRPKPEPTTPTSRRLSFWRLSSSTSSSSPTSSPIDSTSGSAPLSPSVTRNSGDTTAVSSLKSDSKAKANSSQYPVQTLLPVLPPLLPADNPIRASITPAVYTAIYDKIVVNGLTPACPVNLTDVLGSCVAGWKRDGEWPPRSVEAPPPPVIQKKRRKDSNAEKKSGNSRRLSFNLLRRLSGGSDPNAVADGLTNSKQEDPHASKGMRKSLQRVLGLGPDT